MSEALTVFIVDDDAAIRKGLDRSLTARGYTVETYESAQAFLEATGGRRPGCLVLDELMPETTGTQLQAALNRRGAHLPVIFITGHGDVPMAVRALRRGAIDLLEKPFRIEQLVARIDEALRIEAAELARQKHVADVHARFAALTERERDVFAALTERNNVSNKEVARSLGISHRTVEVHRGRILHKMAADSLADLHDMAGMLRECGTDPSRRG